jgi:hypothetical protein
MSIYMISVMKDLTQTHTHYFFLFFFHYRDYLIVLIFSFVFCPSLNFCDFSSPIPIFFPLSSTIPSPSYFPLFIFKQLTTLTLIDSPLLQTNRLFLLCANNSILISPPTHHRRTNATSLFSLLLSHHASVNHPSAERDSAKT